MEACRDGDIGPDHTFVGSAERTFNVRVRKRQLKGLLKEEDLPPKRVKGAKA